MKNYTKTNIGNEGRAELHQALGLTGRKSVSISFRQVPAFLLFIHTKTMRKSTELFPARVRL